MQSRVNNVNLYGENLKYGTYTEQTVPGGSLLRGEVIRNDDPLAMGRVKVMIPSIYYGMPETEIPWAPVLQQGAGAGAGSMIIPEVGTIAVCSFEGGRYDKPIVVGTVYGTGSSTARQISNTVHCQNRQGAMGTANNRTLELSETPVQGQNLNTPILYKSHNGSYVQFDNTTGEDDINIVGHAGDYVRVGNKRIAIETSSGEETGAHVYSGSHLFLNDHDPEYQEEHGAQVELASRDKFMLNMNDATETAVLQNAEKDEQIVLTQKKDMVIRWFRKKLRRILFSATGLELKAGENTIVLDDDAIYISVGSSRVSVSSDSVVVEHGSSKVTCEGSSVVIEASSSIDLLAPFIDLGGDTRLG